MAEGKIRVARGVTMNMGEHEFARFGVEIELPCGVNVADIERVYALALKWVDHKIGEEMAKKEAATA